MNSPTERPSCFVETGACGIRLALGARTSEVTRLVLGRVATLTAAGIVLGLATALAVTRVAGSLLYQVEPGDPVTFAAVAALLVCVALGASYVPLRRATRVDPVVALRYE